MIDLVVVGAGIVGLATARAFLRAHPGASVVVLDKEDRIAAHQSGHNSGVIHAGIYYAPGSDKSRLCRTGRELLLGLCADHAVPHLVRGKVVVATSTAEVGPLSTLQERARRNGVSCSLLGPRALRELEPHVRGVAALHVPATGVVDFAAVCEALAEEVRAAGGVIHLGQAVHAMRAHDASAAIETERETLQARSAVNCGGLHSDELAATSARSPTSAVGRIVPFRGEYYELVPSRDHLVRHLVYPVPDPRFPFLGVHFTRGIDGHVHAGPNAVLALGRESYGWGTVDLGELRSMALDPRLWRLASRYWRTGASELARSLSLTRFVHALQKLVPEVAAPDLVPAGAGVRAQLVRPDGTLVDDFAFHVDPPIVHVLNAPSPAATASLAIGERIAREVTSHRAPGVG